MTHPIEISRHTSDAEALAAIHRLARLNPAKRYRVRRGGRILGTAGAHD